MEPRRNLAGSQFWISNPKVSRRQVCIDEIRRNNQPDARRTLGARRVDGWSKERLALICRTTPGQECRTRNQLQPRHQATCSDIQLRALQTQAQRQHQGRCGDTRIGVLPEPGCAQEGTISGHKEMAPDQAPQGLQPNQTTCASNPMRI